MKWVSFVHRGEPGFGVLDDEGVLDARALAPTLKALLRGAGLASVPPLDELPLISADEVTYLPVIPTLKKSTASASTTPAISKRPACPNRTTR